MNERLKKNIDDCAEIAAHILTTANVDFGGNDPKNFVKFNMASFAMLISGADSTIVYEEAKTIGDYFDLNLVPASVGKIIEDMNILSDDFVSTPPAALVAVVAGDNAISEGGQKLEVWGTQVVFETYKAIAAEIIQSDSDVHEDEVGIANVYLNMMAEYIRKNLKADYTPA